jgi:GT2 family glycosyltransferase
VEPPAIVLERIERRSEICVVVPTFRAADVTAQGLRQLRAANPGVAFDVLLVDNGGEDHEAVTAAAAEEQERLNVVVLAQNAGGAGAFRVAQEKALAAGYRTIVFCDNDAEALGEDGLAALDAHIAAGGAVAVCGHNVETGALERDRVSGFSPMIFFAVSRDAVDRVGLVDPRYFLQGEDMDYVMRLATAGVPLVELASCAYAHPLGKPTTFSNRATYLILRAKLLALHGTASPVAPRLRLRVAVGLVVFLGGRLLSALADPRVAVALARGIRHGLSGELDLDLPENRFRYVEVACNGESAADFNRPWTHLFPMRRYVQRSLRTGEARCYERPVLLRLRGRAR